MRRPFFGRILSAGEIVKLGAPHRKKLARQWGHIMANVFAGISQTVAIFSAVRPELPVFFNHARVISEIVLQ